MLLPQDLPVWLLPGWLLPGWFRLQVWFLPWLNLAFLNQVYNRDSHNLKSLLLSPVSPSLVPNQECNQECNQELVSRKRNQAFLNWELQDFLNRVYNQVYSQALQGFLKRNQACPQ